jgi:predicted secreted protein
MRIVRLGLLAVIAVGVLMLAACDRVTPREDAALPPPIPDGVALVVEETTGPVSLRPGQTFAVALSSNFDWQVEALPDSLELLGTETAPTTAAQRDGGATGGATWFVFHLKAASVGDGELVLVEARGWEPAAIQTRRIAVRVEP